MPRGIHLLTIAALLAACSEAERETGSTVELQPPVVASAGSTECDANTRDVVERLGERLKFVSTLAPDSSVRSAIESNYGELVTSELLARWTSDPAAAPGRDVSSPWPERIEIRSAEPTPDGCRVEAELLYMSSAGTPGTEPGGDTARGDPAVFPTERGQPDSSRQAMRKALSIQLRQNGAWRIRDYHSSGSPPADTP